MAALNMGGESSGTRQALTFLERQYFGKVLLLMLGVGLVCYSIWMFVQSIVDPENLGKKRKALMMRFGLFITGLVYSAIAILAFFYLFTGSYKTDSNKNYLSAINPKVISIIFIIVGIVLAIQAGIIVRRVFKGNMLKQFNLDGRKYYRLIQAIGKYGFYARGFILFIIAYFFLRAGIYTGSNDIKGIQEAFSFLDQSFVGKIMMAITAIGFISYGLFYMLLTKYRTFERE